MNRKNKVGAAFTDDGLAMGKTKRLYKSFFKIMIFFNEVSLQLKVMIFFNEVSLQFKVRIFFNEVSLQFQVRIFFRYFIEENRDFKL
jgi:hypothetical protein